MTKTLSPESLAGLVRLSHHRWMIPLIAEIGTDGGARAAVLGARLDISLPSLRRVVAAARHADLVMTNPGYGHPLRPEYLLTPWGEGLMRECRVVVDLARAEDRRDLMARKWTLPVLAAVSEGANRYGEVLGALPTSTPRVISRALEDLEGAGLIRRTLVDDRPPRPVYAIAEAGIGFAAAAVALAEAACRC